MDKTSFSDGFRLSHRPAFSSSGDFVRPGKKLVYWERATCTPRLKGMMVLTVERDEEQFVVSDSVFNMFGTGRSEQEAIEDYKHSLAEYCRLLEDHKEDASTNHANAIRQHLEF